MRNRYDIKLNNPNKFGTQLLRWSDSFKQVAYLNSNSTINSSTNSYDLIVAVDAINYIQAHSQNKFNELKIFYEQTKDWVFGHLSYDLKNEIENLQSANFDGIQFPDMYFFQPRYLFFIKNDELTVAYLTEHTSEDEIKKILATVATIEVDTTSDEPIHAIQSRIKKSDYIKKVNAVKQHIQQGDIYEMNLCMEYFSENININVVSTYEYLNKISQTPFSAFYKLNDKYVLSASPERFLKKSGTKLLSQPIKGTIKRGENSAEDEQLKTALHNNKKERNENVMIVDLVRNDLSRSAISGSVKVDELYGIYTFSQVHQMISSISAELRPDLHFIDALKNAFPMGSMTGAPKVKAMQLIEQYETTKRGLYSGAIGYISPEGDFDFNVIIRSILYNASTKYLSFIVGSAITNQSNAEDEYNECLLKGKAMFEVLGESKIVENV